MAKQETKTNAISQGITFLSDSKEEIKKVHFPNRQETIQWTILVLAMLIAFSFFLGAADWIVGGIMREVLT